jgi:hypothetical protein
MRSREYLEQFKQTTSLSPRRSRVKLERHQLCVAGSVTTSCEITNRKESEHD